MDEVRPQPMNILDGISNRMRKVMNIDNGSINNGIFLLVAENSGGFTTGGGGCPPSGGELFRVLFLL